MRELEKQGIYACALPMPNPDAPIKDEWVAEIARVISNDAENYLIGHSLGVPAILHYLQTTNLSITGAVLVSGPFDSTRDEIKSFYGAPFDFEKIKSSCRIFKIIHGDNDPNVPFEHAERFSKILNAELISVTNGKHLNGSAGCFELPEALSALNDMMK